MDIAGFYDADERRRESDEVSYGDGWTTSADPHATYKAAYVVTTQELYTVREPHPGGILARYLDQLDVDQAGTDEMTVEVLLTAPQEQVDTVLMDWADQMETDNSLEWLRRQVTPG